MKTIKIIILLVLVIITGNNEKKEPVKINRLNAHGHLK